MQPTNDPVLNAFIAWLERQMNEAGVNQVDLQRLGGPSNSATSAVLNGVNRPTKKFCYRLANAMGLDPALVLQKAGFDDKGIKVDVATLDQLDLEAVEYLLIDLYRGLTPEHKRDLLAIAQVLKDNQSM